MDVEDKIKSNSHRDSKYDFNKLRNDEFLRAKCWETNSDLFYFITSIYRKLFDFIFSLEKRQHETKDFLDELENINLYHRVFAHTHNGRFKAEQLRGSVGEASPLFLKNLPQKSPFYFHTVMTAICNAIYQYAPTEDVYGLCRMDLGVNYSGLKSILEFKKNDRLALEIEKDVVSFLDFPLEELQARFYPGQHRSTPASGEQQFLISKESNYVIDANCIGAPTLTGPSSNSYTIFKCLTQLLALDNNHQVMLRKCLIVYMLASHNHTFLEVIDPINTAIDELSDESDMKVTIYSHQEYCSALNNILPFFQKTSVVNNINLFLNENSFPSWASAIIKLYTLEEKCISAIILKINYLFSQLIACDQEILKYFFGEDMDESHITNLDAMIDLFSNVYSSDVDIQLLGETFLATNQHSSIDEKQSKKLLNVIEKFGLCATRHGSSFNRINFPACPIKVHSCSYKAKHDNRGALLCIRGYTPLLHFIWTLAGISSMHSFLLRSDHAESKQENLFPLLSLQLNVLEHSGYHSEEIKIEGRPYTRYMPPNKEPVYRLNNFFDSKQLIDLDSKQNHATKQQPSKVTIQHCLAKK